MNYKKIAKEMAEAKDPGGELVKLLDELQQYSAPSILITQAIPDEGEGNPLIGIAVMSNIETDFPLDSDEAFIKWVEDYLEFLKTEVPDETV